MMGHRSGPKEEPELEFGGDFPEGRAVVLQSQMFRHILHI